MDDEGGRWVYTRVAPHAPKNVHASANVSCERSQAVMVGMSTWEPARVATWLTDVGYPSLASAAVEVELDGAALLEMDNAAWSELGATSALVCAKLTSLVKKAAAIADAASPPTANDRSSNPFEDAAEPDAADTVLLGMAGAAFTLGNELPTSAAGDTSASTEMVNSKVADDPGPDFRGSKHNPFEAVVGDANNPFGAGTRQTNSNPFDTGAADAAPFDGDAAPRASAAAPHAAAAPATIAPPVATPAQEVLCGWLQKQDPSVLSRRYQRRYFVLSPISLDYYRTESRDELLKQVPMGEVLGVSGATDAGLSKNESEFHVRTDGRTYKLLAASGDEKRKWMEALAQAHNTFQRLDMAAVMSQKGGDESSASPAAREVPKRWTCRVASEADVSSAVVQLVASHFQPVTQAAHADAACEAAASDGNGEDRGSGVVVSAVLEVARELMDEMMTSAHDFRSSSPPRPELETRCVNEFHVQMYAPWSQRDEQQSTTTATTRHAWCRAHVALACACHIAGTSILISASASTRSDLGTLLHPSRPLAWTWMRSSSSRGFRSTATTSRSLGLRR